MNFSRSVKMLFVVIILSISLHNCLSEDTRLYFEPRTNEHSKLNIWYSSSLKFASYYGDHMVLQQAPKKSTVWGYADTEHIGKVVTARLLAVNGTHESTYKTTVEKGHVNRDAVWSVQLNPRPAGGPYNLTVSVQGTTIMLADVLFGDIWLCGGQSNMEFTVPMMFPEMVDLEYKKSETYENIRVFTAALEASEVPLYDLKSVMEKWSRPSPDALGKGQKSFTYFSATCWIYGRRLYETLGYPIGLLASDWGGTPDEAWMSPDALKQCGLDAIQKTVKSMHADRIHYAAFNDEEYKRCCAGPGQNSVLWNAMIHPLLNLTITGAIWYQGEADAAKTNYYCTFPAMISDWRSKFHIGTKGETDPTFPFGFVQLAGWEPPAPGNITTGFSYLRWQQTANYGVVPNHKMPNTFMAVAMDLPDFRSPFGSIHPRDKETVGFRLAAGGLSQAYKINTKFQGPVPTQIKTEDDSIQIIYDEGKTALNVRSTWGFELCCPTQEQDGLCPVGTYGTPWYEASIIAHSTTTVTISATNCTTQVRAIRYAWRESPCEYKMCAIYSVDNELPAPPMYINKTQLLLEDTTGNIFRIKY